MANKIILLENGMEKIVEDNTIEGLTICFLDKSDNNIVKIAAPYSFHNVSIYINGNNNEVEIGKDCIIRSSNIYMTAPADYRKLLIGNNFFFAGGRIDLPTKNNIGIIGNDCLFSANITIFTEDGYPIYNIYSKEMLNKGGTFKIGNHVWLGYGTTVCKNVEITDNVVVGACSVVTKSLLDKNCAYGGCPAKLLKKGIVFSNLTITGYDALKKREKGEENG